MRVVAGAAVWSESRKYELNSLSRAKLTLNILYHLMTFIVMASKAFAMRSMYTELRENIIKISKYCELVSNHLKILTPGLFWNAKQKALCWW